ncbi:MAG: NUDIX domain-containing protein [Clostridiales bacterium]|nr:NUDIX domain-containing protein [Clostridiales bacterium]
MAELHDLYTADRAPTGETIARGERVPEGRFRIIVHVVILNDENDMLIQRRQPFKEGWPGRWDLSVGGSAVHGETARMAAERETGEELGLALKLPEEPPAITLRFSGGFDDIFVARRNVDLNSLALQPEEVAEACWASKEQVHRMIDDGAFIPYKHALIDLLFSYTGKGDGGRDI